jgi:hypothetical protein
MDAITCLAHIQVTILELQQAVMIFPRSAPMDAIKLISLFVLKNCTLSILSVKILTSL